MLTLEGLHDNAVLAVKASGYITKEDYEDTLPELDRLIARHGPLRFFIHLDDVEGIEPKALWEDAKFDWMHRNDYEKIAMVGDRQWQDWATAMSKPFFKAETKFFREEESDRAWQWVQQ